MSNSESDADVMALAPPPRQGLHAAVLNKAGRRLSKVLEQEPPDADIETNTRTA